MSPSPGNLPFARSSAMYLEKRAMGSITIPPNTRLQSFRPATSAWRQPRASPKAAPLSTAAGGDASLRSRRWPVKSDTRRGTA
jgi:hypothetical protein